MFYFNPDICSLSTYAQKKEFVLKFLRIHGFCSNTFQKILSLYKQIQSNHPVFVEWFCGTFLNELFFILKYKSNQTCDFKVMETLSHLMCGDSDIFQTTVTEYTEDVFTKAYDHQLNPSFSYHNIVGVDDNCTALYD